MDCWNNCYWGEVLTGRLISQSKFVFRSLFRKAFFFQFIAEGLCNGGRGHFPACAFPWGLHGGRIIVNSQYALWSQKTRRFYGDKGNDPDTAAQTYALCKICRTPCMALCHSNYWHKSSKKFLSNVTTYWSQALTMTFLNELLQDNSFHVSMSY